MILSLKNLLGEVIRRNASDLHLNVGVPPVMRIDGELRYLEELGYLTGSDIENGLREVLTDEQMEKYKETNDLDFSIPYKSVDNNTEARFRGNAFYVLREMAAAFRMIPQKIRSIDDLGLSQTLKEVCKKRRGLFLVTGPTGHGKSTTLAAILNEINNTRFDHIITIEDPVEFIFTSKKCLVQQREVGVDTPGFTEGLRRALRQDPDIIFIGEMRDLETISTAISAAETGHLVLGTLHTQDAAQSIERLVDAFAATHQEQIRMQLSNTLVGVCSQQLIPMRKEAGGGRICATELLIANPAVRNCVRHGKTNQIKTLIQTGLSYGMHTMEQCLATLILNGTLPQDIALAYAYDLKELNRILGYVS